MRSLIGFRCPADILKGFVEKFVADADQPLLQGGEISIRRIRKCKFALYYIYDIDTCMWSRIRV